jgi:predicted SAM-dependent methyltransferase
LHIGGVEKTPAWEILNALPGPHVDHLGDARDLSRFSDNTFLEIYASHVLEHLDYANNELLNALKEWCRVLVPGGNLYVSVPDLDVLSRLFLEKDRLNLDERFFVMRMMFGGHIDKYDYHVVGLNQDFLAAFLHTAGYVNFRRVNTFGLFQDTSVMVYKGEPISINVTAQKPAA